MREPILLPLGKGLRIYFLLLLSFSFFQLAAQPCPSIINCPQSTPTYCDVSDNDLSMWNNPPFTYSPTIGDANLHEGPIDLNIKVKGCSGGGITSISYLLYLDLDNDNLQETVIMSGTPPPGGRVMANNSFNPGYSGGDTVLFDQRAIPDSLLYRFSLEIAYSGDTTTGWVRFSNDYAPYDFSPVVLPEGRHRIEWRIVQDGVERNCDRNFKIKDCKNPTVVCKVNAPIYLDASLTATLPLSQAYNLITDNITPDSQLLIGMRRAGTGTGFPLNPMGQPQDTAMFNCDTNENQFVEVWAKDKAGNLEHCNTSVLVYDTAGICPIIPPPPPPNPVSICASTYWNGETIRDVAFTSSWTGQGNQPTHVHLPLKPNGCAELSTLPPTNFFALGAAKDTVPLNGVTTYDLVLISKHILAIEPFEAGWKLAAADANRSGSVTTFDIVELRKLILGLTAKLPNNTPSWRFFVDTCSISGSPFSGNCASFYNLPVLPLGSYPAQINFKGLKIGDVNGSASSVDTLLNASAQARSSATVLELPDLQLKTGETLELPLRAVEGGEWEGMQFSLKYNPELLEIEDLNSGDGFELSAENWAKPDAGVLNLSWSDAVPAPVLPGDAWARLRVRALAPLRLSAVLNLSTERAMISEAYDSEGQSHPLQLRYTDKENTPEKRKTQVFAPMPNPTTGAANLPLRLNVSERVSIEISDLNGSILWRQVNDLEAGAHFIEIPAVATASSGVYVWRVCAGNETQSGRLVRI